MAERIMVESFTPEAGDIVIAEGPDESLPLVQTHIEAVTEKYVLFEDERWTTLNRFLRNYEYDNLTQAWQRKIC